MASSRLHHVALLAGSLEALLPRLAARGWQAGPLGSFPKEGTRETYVDLPQRGGPASGPASAPAGPSAPASGRLLLVAPAGPGPYARALAERGPGLHHLGLAATSLAEFAAALSASGWFVHPYSLRDGGRLRDLWLCRPGVPALIEVFEDAAAPEAEGALIRGVDLPVPEGLPSLLESLGCPAVRPAAGRFTLLHTATGVLSVDELLAGSGR